jgi:hypothetical protein
MSLSKVINAGASAPSLSERLPYFMALFGGSLLLVTIPWLAVVIALTMLWYGMIGWAYKTAPAVWFGNKMSAGALWLGKRILRDERDSPYLFSYFGIGMYAPLLFMGSYWVQVTYLDANITWGWPNWLAALAYNVLNYGPYFAFFSQVATMIHKEGHSPKGIFKGRLSFLNNYHGHVLSLLYGHVPQGYPMGHMRIHHKHDNAPDDVTSTVYYDRSHTATIPRLPV